MRVTGLPLLLAGTLLVLGSGTALVVREDFQTEELAAAFILMGAGLVLLGAWAAIEIRALRGGNRFREEQPDEADTEVGPG